MISKNCQDFKNCFVHLSWKTYPFISILLKMFFLSQCSVILWWLQIKDRLLANVRNKEIWGNITSNLGYLVFIRSISDIASNNKSLKFNLLSIFKFRCDRVHKKMLNDAYLTGIYMEHVRDTKQTSWRVGLTKNSAEYFFHFKFFYDQSDKIVLRSNILAKTTLGFEKGFSKHKLSISYTLLISGKMLIGQYPYRFCHLLWKQVWHWHVTN